MYVITYQCDDHVKLSGFQGRVGRQGESNRVRQVQGKGRREGNAAGRQAYRVRQVSSTGA